jgi:hypothetical protein
VSAAKGVNLAVRFLLELAALAALAVAGWQLATSAALGLLLAVLLPLAAAAVWGRFVAPKASRRLADPARLLVEAGVFGSAVAALLLAGHPGWAATMAAVVVVNEALLFAWRQREH